MAKFRAGDITWDEVKRLTASKKIIQEEPNESQGDSDGNHQTPDKSLSTYDMSKMRHPRSEAPTIAPSNILMQE